MTGAFVQSGLEAWNLHHCPRLHQPFELLAKLPRELDDSNQHTGFDIPLLRPLREIRGGHERCLIVNDDDLREISVAARPSWSSVSRRSV